MQTIDIVLDLSHEQALRLYRGAQSVHTQTTDGQTIELPAGVLFDVMEHSGVRGVYRVTLGPDSRFKRIQKVRNF